MKPSEAKVLARRLRMFKADPNCFWCGKLTVLYGEQSQPDLATIDHLYSRLHPERKERYKAGHDRSALLHVLACYACNHKRGKSEQQGYVFVPDLESRREFARQVSAVNGVVAEKPQENPPMRVICTTKEAVEFAKEQAPNQNASRRSNDSRVQSALAKKRKQRDNLLKSSSPDRQAAILRRFRHV